MAFPPHYGECAAWQTGNRLPCQRGSASNAAGTLLSGHGRLHGPLVSVAGSPQIVGSYLGFAEPARDIPRFEQMLRDGRLPVKELITASIGLDNINDAKDGLAAGRAIRQVAELPL